MGDPEEGNTGSGATYVFSGSGSTWSTGVVVKSVKHDNGAELGVSVAVSGDLGIEGAVHYEEKSRGAPRDSVSYLAPDPAPNRVRRQL